VSERKESRSLVVCPTGRPLSSPSSLVYPGGPPLPPSKGAPAPSPRAHQRGTVVPHRACQQGLSPNPLLNFLPVRPPPARHRRPVLVHSPRNGRDGVCVSPRAAAATRQEGASPPPRTGGALAPAPSHARPRPYMDRADGTDASTLAAGWARPPPTANNSQCRRGRGVLAGVRRL